MNDHDRKYPQPEGTPRGQRAFTSNGMPVPYRLVPFTPKETRSMMHRVYDARIGQNGRGSKVFYSTENN